MTTSAFLNSLEIALIRGQLLPHSPDLPHVMERVDAMELAPFFHRERAKTGMHHHHRPAPEPFLAIINYAIHFSQI